MTGCGSSQGRGKKPREKHNWTAVRHGFWKERILFTFFLNQQAQPGLHYGWFLAQRWGGELVLCGTWWPWGNVQSGARRVWRGAKLSCWQGRGNLAPPPPLDMCKVSHPEVSLSPASSSRPLPFPSEWSAPATVSCMLLRFLIYSEPPFS